MKVSVVIAAYNAEKTIGECLEGCLRQTMAAHEIIVVDDGSSDLTRERVERFVGETLSVTASGSSCDAPVAVPTFSREDQNTASVRASGVLETLTVNASDTPSVRYLHQANAGPAAARNRGAAAATGDVVAFTDSDCVPDARWLEGLTAGFTDDTIAGVGGTYAIANPQSLLARMVHEEIVMRHERMGGEVDFLGSFNVAYGKSAFDAAGGFDETFRAASGEDNDLAYRIQDRGGRLCFTREAVVAHYHPERLWPYLRTQYRHGYWRVKLYTKHAGRARGDRYAGFGDLMAPTVAFALLMWIPFTVINWGEEFSFYLGALFTAAAFLIYLALQGWKGIPVARRAGPAAVVAFPVVLFLRDIARELGAFRGVWDFNVLRQGMD